MADQQNVTILVFDDVEVLDFAGPFEVFSVAAKLIEPSPFNVYTVAPVNLKVRTTGNLQIEAHYTIQTCPPPDMLLVPGGWGTRALLNDQDVIGWISEQASQTDLLLSVCTGSLLLARAQLLGNLGVTTHHGAFDLLQKEATTARILRDRRYVDNGHIITSAGISAGIDMSLHVLAKQLGADVAQLVADHMEYRWLP